MKSGLSLFRCWANRVKRIVRPIEPDPAAAPLVSAQTFTEKDFLSLFDLDQVSEALSRKEFDAANAALVDHYSKRPKSTWPVPPKVVTDLRIDLDELDRTELIKLANRILEHHFSPDDTLPVVTAEGKIDWCANPIQSPEWLWRLNRHQWWPILGLAYAQTGSARYPAAFVDQMTDWVRRNPPPSGKDEQSPTWRLMEIAMRMRVSWIPSFGLFNDSPLFTAESKLLMLRSIYDHARFLSQFQTSRNHLLRESNGLAFTSVYFPEFKDARLWQEIALGRLDRELTIQFNPDGSHIELSTGYQWMVLDEYENIYELLKANNLSLPKQNLADWLEKMYLALALRVRPDGTFPEINDGFIRWSYNRLAQAGQEFGREDFTYIGTAGKAGSTPPYSSARLTNAGLHVMRSDWSPDSRYLLFDAGPYGGYHGHEDALSIEVFAYGQAFIVDSGSYTYDSADPFRTYFMGSQGHNTVMVDCCSQIRRWQKEHVHPRSCAKEYATWVSRTDFDYVAASYSDGYGHFSLQQSKDARIIADVTHTRRVVFLKPHYWVILDELQSPETHDYQLLFHAPPEIAAEILPDGSAVLSTQSNGPRLLIVPAEPQNLSVRVDFGSESPIQGWYSVDHHLKSPSAAVVYETQNRSSAALATLIYPCVPGKAGDAPGISPIEVSVGNGLAFEVITDYGRDYVMFSEDNQLKQFGQFQSSAMLSGIRTGKGGDILTRFEWRSAQ